MFPCLKDTCTAESNWTEMADEVKAQPRWLSPNKATTTKASNTPRRHSIAATAFHGTDQLKSLHSFNASGLGNGSQVKPKRRQSIQESLQSITKSMSNSLQKAMNIGGSSSSLIHDEGKTRLTKSFFKDVLSTHYKQPDLKVTKLSLRHVPNPHTNQVLHEVEVFVKDSKGRRKLDLLTKYSSDQIRSGRSSRQEMLEEARSNPDNPGWVLDGTNDEMERELRAYEDVIEDMWRYLRMEKTIAEPEQYLCLPMRYRTNVLRDLPTKANKHETIEEVVDELGMDDELTSPGASGGDILVLQDLFASGYRSAAQDRLDENGLDFNHSIMAITRLARFHAVSFAMRKEKSWEMENRYPFLRDDPVYRPETFPMFAKAQSSMATRLLSIFQHSSTDLRAFTNYFMDAVKNLHSIQSDFVRSSEKFGVLCHGDLWRQNVLFFYGSSLECQTDCLDVRFEDLHRARFSSCVTDLLYFLFTTVDSEVRKDHIMDFLAVYHDHFSKTVTKLAPNVSVFNREELFEEFRSHLMFGFLEGLCLFSAVYESQLRRTEDEERERDAAAAGYLTGATARKSSTSEDVDTRPRYADYKDAVVSMIGDVIRLQLQGEAAGPDNQQSK